MSDHSGNRDLIGKSVKSEVLRTFAQLAAQQLANDPTNGKYQAAILQNVANKLPLQDGIDVSYRGFLAIVTAATTEVDKAHPPIALVSPPTLDKSAMSELSSTEFASMLFRMAVQAQNRQHTL